MSDVAQKAVPPAAPNPNNGAAASRYRRRVEALVAFGHRGSAGANEHRACDYLLHQLQSFVDANATKEGFAGSRTMAARLLTHVLPAMAGVPFVSTVPWITAASAVIALASLVAEQMTYGVFLSRWTCRAISYNVVGRVPARGLARRRVALCAHYDTQPTGWVWALGRLGRPIWARLPAGLKPPMLTLALLMLAQVAVAAAALVFRDTRWARLAGLAAGLLLVPYAAYALLLAQWLFGRYVPGAADNASGVAAALEIAEAWVDDPPAVDVDLLVVLTGCEESGLMGAAAWADRLIEDRAAPPTTVLNIDGLGFGPPRFLGSEVPVVGLPLRAPASLVAVCGRVAAEMGLCGAGPHALPGPTDALAFHARHIPAVSVVGFADGEHLPNYHSMNDTVARMDFASARIGTAFANAVARALASAAQGRG